MFRHGSISTEIDKGPFFFTLAAFAGSLAGAVLLFVLGGSALAVFAGIMLSVVAVVGGIILFAMLTDKAYISDGILTMRYLFRKNRISVKEIGKISLKDDIYSVYRRNGSLAGTMNAKLSGIGTVLLELDKNKVPFA